MLDDVKAVLRENGNHSDTEILDLINSAKADLILSGINKDKVIDDDPLIKRAINLYCKANYGYDDPKIAERFQSAYNSLKNHLTLSIEYTGGA